MRKQYALPLLFAFAITYFSLGRIPKSLLAGEDPPQSSTLYIDKNKESLLAFNTMMDVLTHQRCVNCHPSDDVPKQGEDSHPHRLGITRANGTGATNCGSCHQAANNDYSGVPGAPHWALAPHKMRWEGLSRTEIAESMMNPKNNGNRSPEDIMHHLTEHELVLWAWEPGLDGEGNPREAPPVPVEEYIAAVKKWIELGAIIPAQESE